jgi:hypothetical protein
MKTNKYKIPYIFILLLFCQSLLSQEWIAFNNSQEITEPSIRILSSSANEITFRIHLDGFLKEDVIIDSTTYQKIYFSGDQTLQKVGYPALPVISKLIGLPPNSEFRISIVDSVWKKLSKYTVIPYQQPLLETEELDGYTINNIFYSSSLSYPDTMYEYSEKMNWKGIENINLTLCPFKYSPAEQTLDVITDFTVKIDFTTEDTENTNLIEKLNTKNDQAFKNQFFNFNNDLIKSYYDNTEIDTVESSQSNMPILRTTTTSSDYDYLIISAPSYLDSSPLYALKDWKSRIGLKCKIVSTSATGTSVTDIKDYIVNEYTNNGIKYVLLVGDYSDIPLYDWSNAYSDYWYGCITPGGLSDLQAEIPIGRFSISNLTELENMVNKSINYEKKPPLNNWTKKSLLIAHKQDAPSKYQGCKESIRTASYTISSPIFSLAYGATSTYGGNSATNQTIIDAINNGIGLINYRGHGSETGWDSGWSTEGKAFNSDEIENLTNTTQTPVIFSIACLNAAIQSSNVCLLENFTRKTNGSVAFLGATEASYTEVNHTFDKALYKLVYNTGIYNIGNLLVQADITAMTANSSNYYSKYNAKIYLWGGDPSLELWTDTLNQFTNVSVSDDGTNVIVNTGGVSNCDIIVCSSLDDGDSYFEKAESVSYSTFCNVVRPYYVTVRKHNYIPFLSDTYIQNKFIENNAYISGNNIYIGSNVTSYEPSGEVIIENGANVLFDASNKILINGLFKTNLGGSFHVVNP